MTPLLLLVLLLLAPAASASLLLQLQLEHSLDGGASFRRRALYSATPSLPHSLTRSPSSGDEDITREELQAFKQLLATGGHYMLRLSEVTSEGTSEAVMATIPACELQKSNFKEELALHLDRGGALVGLHLTSPVIALPRACDPRKISDEKGFAFQTKVRIVEPTTAGVIPVQATGPRPPALASVKMDVEDVGEAGKPEANQSFLRKYWYIVLPMVIFTLFGGAEPPPEGAGQGADGKGGGAAPAVASAPSK